MSRVAIARQTKYEESGIRNAMLSIIANSDFPDCRGKSVLIKPNILSDSEPGRHITTNPMCVSVLIDILREKGAGRIVIGDSPGMAAAGFRPVRSGFQALVDEKGVEWADFVKESRTHEVWKGIRLPMAKAIDESDVVISFAKFKTHQLMYATGAVKNMFGLVPGLNKSPQHLKARSPENFAQLITSIALERKMDYAFIDAIIGMEGPGPANGTPRAVGLLMGSDNPFALDRAEAVIMGYSPKDVPIVALAMKEKRADAEYTLLDAEDLAIEDYRRIEVKRKGLFSSLILPFFTRSADRRKARKRTAPSFRSDRCRRCRKCIEICPAKALRLEDGRVEIDTESCIRCYCCHEMCPFDAIVIS